MLHCSTKRLGLAALALAGASMLGLFTTHALAQDEKPAAAAQPAKNLPEADKLFEKSIEAMGGREAFKNMKSMHVIANLQAPNFPDPIVFDLTRGQKDKMYFKQIMPAAMGGMTLTGGSDGDTVWMNNPMTGGYQILDGPMRDQMLDQTMIVRHDMLDDVKKKAKSYETIGSETFGDEDCWKVKVTDADDSDSMLYFSKKTGRMLGLTATKQGMMGTTDVTMRLLEWKEFAPFTLYTKMEMDQGGQLVTIDFATIEVDKADPSIFELPAEVKEMAAKKKADEKPAGEEPGGDAPGTPE